MKNHIPLFMLCCALFFVSCDDSTTKNGEIEEAVYYEASFHMYALENETEDTQDQLSQTEEEIEENCKGEQDMSEKCQELRKRRDSLKLKLNSGLDKMEKLATFLANIEPDLPDVPCPPEGNCDFSNLKQILINPEVIDFSVLFFDLNDKIVENNSTFEEATEDTGFGTYILDENLHGHLRMRIEKTSEVFKNKVIYEMGVDMGTNP